MGGKKGIKNPRFIIKHAKNSDYSLITRPSDGRMRLIMILRSTGFLTSSLIRSRNAVNFAYILYLRGRGEGVPADDIERLVRRWYAMSILTQRYSGSPETAFDFDIRQIEAQGVQPYTESVIENEMPETFWTGMLPQLMDTSSSTSPSCTQCTSTRFSRESGRSRRYPI